MNKPKLIITGGSGLLGQYLNGILNEDYDILTFYRSNPANCLAFHHAQVDITDFARLLEVLREFRPEFVIHCAAVSNPNKADLLSSADVNRANVLATELIAKECEKLGAGMLYTSTDLVYAGYRGSYLKEDAKLVPLSLYAETKLMGEVKIKEVLGKFIIVRTPLQFGAGYNGTTNNFQEMVRRFVKGEKVKLFSDQFRTPLAVRESARIIKELLSKPVFGEVVNMGCSRRVSRVQLGELACASGGFSTNLIDSCVMDDAPGIIQVADVSLDISKLRSFGIEPEELEMMVDLEVKEIVKSING